MTSVPSPFSSPDATLERLAEILRAPASGTRTLRWLLDTLDCEPAALIDALIDLRHTHPELNTAEGFPRTALTTFEKLIQLTAERHPDALRHVHAAAEAALDDGRYDGLLETIARIYGLDFRLPSSLRRHEGVPRVDLARQRAQALATLSRRADWGLLPTERFSDLAELWSEATEADAITWYERAFPAPIDPFAYMERPTEERLRAALSSDNPLHYRHYLGKLPPMDLLDVALTTELPEGPLRAFAEATLQSSRRPWKRVGRQILERLDDGAR